ncbi:MAG: lipid-A-disaccharide synthase, partial [Gammaproteobacteria bacterium]
MRIGMVAGEASGDRLGAGLIAALRCREGHLVVEGIGGARMQEAGCKVLYPMDRLAVMGVVEVLGRYRELAAARARLAQHFLSNPPDLFVGIDAPEFNLALEERLRAAGVRTAHYVSPQVWAWRPWRVRRIARAVDLMLVLYPFEESFYQSH